MNYPGCIRVLTALSQRVCKRLFIPVLFALGCSSANAQASLGVGGGGLIYGWLDTVSAFDSASYYIWVKNTGNAVFSGNVHINLSVDTGQGPMYIGYDSVAYQLAPGDSIPYSKTVFYNFPGFYRLGGNIVVIWPSSSGITTTDSTRDTTVWITGNNSIYESERNKVIRLYPNPCSDKFSIRSLVGKREARLVEVMNVHGQVLAVHRNIHTVSMKDFANGIYFVRIEFPDGMKKTYKLIRKE